MSELSETREPIRDFIYLDWERVRSIAAQLFGGVPESAVTEKQRETGVDGRIEAGFLSFLKGGAGGDLRFLKLDNETRSLHHYVYALAEEQLAREELVQEFGNDFDFSKWTKEYFRDGQFVLVQGLVRILDYKWLTESMESLPEILKFAQNSQMMLLYQQKASGLVTDDEIQKARSENKKQAKELKDMKLSDMKDVIQQLFGDVVRIKILPDKDHNKHVFAGFGSTSNFIESASSLSQSYGYEIDAGWLVFGMVNISPQRETPLSIPVGNELEDKLEQATMAMTEMYQVASEVKFPAVSITPISIYRELSI